MSGISTRTKMSSKISTGSTGERRDYNRYYAGARLGEAGELRPFDQYDTDWCGRGGSVD